MPHHPPDARKRSGIPGANPEGCGSDADRLPGPGDRSRRRAWNYAERNHDQRTDRAANQRLLRGASHLAAVHVDTTSCRNDFKYDSKRAEQRIATPRSEEIEVARENVVEPARPIATATIANERRRSGDVAANRIRGTNDGSERPMCTPEYRPGGLIRSRTALDDADLDDARAMTRAACALGPPGAEDVQAGLTREDLPAPEPADHEDPLSRSAEERPHVHPTGIGPLLVHRFEHVDHVHGITDIAVPGVAPRAQPKKDLRGRTGFESCQRAIEDVQPEREALHPLSLVELTFAAVLV